MRNCPHHTRQPNGSSLISSRAIKLAVVASFLVLTALSTSVAQVNNEPSSDASFRPQAVNEGIQKRWNEFGIWGGVSFDSPTLIGKTADARFGNVGLRYGRVLAASKTVAFEWTIDVIPVAILSNPRFALVPSGTTFVITETRKSVYGWGAAPIGLKFNFRRNRRVQPFGRAT